MTEQQITEAAKWAQDQCVSRAQLAVEVALAANPGPDLTENERLCVDIGIQAGSTSTLEWVAECFDLTPKRAS